MYEITNYLDIDDINDPELLKKMLKETKKELEFLDKIASYNVDKPQKNDLRDRIQQAKACFSNLTKGGYNNYQKYKYLEPEDIFPRVREVACKYEFKTEFNRLSDRMELKIMDKLSSDEVVFTTPVPVINNADAGRFMQDVGRVQTYAMRYLYIQAFEIAVPDEIDNRDQSKKTAKPNKTANRVVRKNLNKYNAGTKIDVEISEERVKQILDTAYARVTDAGKEFNLANALWTINRLADSEAEKEAVKKALDQYKPVKEGK